MAGCVRWAHNERVVFRHRASHVFCNWYDSPCVCTYAPPTVGQCTFVQPHVRKWTSSWIFSSILLYISLSSFISLSLLPELNRWNATLMCVSCCQKTYIVSHNLAIISFSIGIKFQKRKKTWRWKLCVFWPTIEPFIGPVGVHIARCL